MADKYLSTGTNALNKDAFNITKPLIRYSNKPLETSGFFANANDADNYAKNDDMAYIGQELTVFDTTDTNKAYKYFVSNTNTITKLLDERSISVAGASSFDSNVTFKVGIQIGSYSITTSGIPAEKLIGDGKLPDAVLPTKFSSSSPIVTFSATTSSGNTVLTPKSISVDSKGRVTGVTDGSSVTISAVDEKVKQTSSAANGLYPILTRTNVKDAAGNTAGTYYDNSVTINHSTGTLFATKIGINYSYTDEKGHTGGTLIDEKGNITAKNNVSAASISIKDTNKKVDLQYDETLGVLKFVFT